MSTATWKPARASAWGRLCSAACGDAQMAAVALVDSSALHFFVSEPLLAKLSFPVLPGDGMEVMLSDRSQVEASKTCLAPLVVCSAH